MLPENFEQAHSLALTRGVNAADAAVFAVYYLTELAGYREVAHEVYPRTPEACALDAAWEFLPKYQQQRAAGHSERWAKAYAASIEDADAAREEAYHALGEEERQDEQGSVYAEAYAARIHQGHRPEYAAAYAKYVVAEDAERVEKYIAAYVAMREKGQSEIYAHAYAADIADDAAPGFASLSAGFYEHALAEGLSAFYAWMYADKLTQSLYAREVDQAGQIFNALLVEGYVAGHHYASTNRLAKVETFADSTSNEYINLIDWGEDEELPAAAIRKPALQQAVQTVAKRWNNRG